MNFFFLARGPIGLQMHFQFIYIYFTVYLKLVSIGL